MPAVDIRTPERDRCALSTGHTVYIYSCQETRRDIWFQRFRQPNRLSLFSQNPPIPTPHPQQDYWEWDESLVSQRFPWSRSQASSQGWTASTLDRGGLSCPPIAPPDRGYLRACPLSISGPNKCCQRPERGGAVLVEGRPYISAPRPTHHALATHSLKFVTGRQICQAPCKRLGQIWFIYIMISVCHPTPIQASATFGGFGGPAPEGTTSQNSETRPQDQADNLDGTPPAN